MGKGRPAMGEARPAPGKAPPGAQVGAMSEPGALTVEPTEASPPRARSLGRLWEQWGIALVLVVLAGVAGVVDPSFLSTSNIQSILRESAFVGIAAAGMTFALVNGTFDLSVGGQLALISSVSLMGYAAGGTPGAILAALAAGLMCGLTNGLIITRLRVTPFVATLGTLFLFRGITYVLTQDGPKTLPYSEVGSAFVQIGSGNIAGIPITFILMVLVYAAAWVLLRRTVTGRRIIAFGSSPAAARFCGISGDRLRLFVFTLIGFCVGIASLTFVTRVWTADGGIADGFELQVIAAVLLGGTSLKGGRGTLLGTFAAVLLLAGLNDFLVTQRVPASWQRIVLGTVLITALAIDGLRTGYARPGAWRWLRRRRTEVMPVAK
jgi:ribose/xylose/arabinose/galactoside ABC-type transport system permease subunit